MRRSMGRRRFGLWCRHDHGRPTSSNPSPPGPRPRRPDRGCPGWRDWWRGIDMNTSDRIKAIRHGGGSWKTDISIRHGGGIGPVAMVDAPGDSLGGGHCWAPNEASRSRSSGSAAMASSALISSSVLPVLIRSGSAPPTTWWGGREPKDVGSRSGSVEPLLEPARFCGSGVSEPSGSSVGSGGVSEPSSEPSSAAPKTRSS